MARWIFTRLRFQKKFNGKKRWRLENWQKCPQIYGTARKFRRTLRLKTPTLSLSASAFVRKLRLTRLHKPQLFTVQKSRAAGPVCPAWSNKVCVHVVRSPSRNRLIGYIGIFVEYRGWFEKKENGSSEKRRWWLSTGIIPDKHLSRLIISCAFLYGLLATLTAILSVQSSRVACCQFV